MKFTQHELDYLLNTAKRNRENSASLAEVPGQRWKEAHKSEVRMMDALIEKLQAMGNTSAKPHQMRYEIVLSDGSINGNILYSTSSKANFEGYVLLTTEKINSGQLDAAKVWLRDIRETPILAFLNKTV